MNPARRESLQRMIVATGMLLMAACAGVRMHASSDAPAPLIEIDARFVGLTEAAAGRVELKKLLAHLENGGAPEMLTGQQVQALFKKLDQADGVDILAAPRVTTRSKQRATIEMVQDFHFATDWEQDIKPGTWKPKAVEVKKVGITFAVDPDITTDGNIALDIKPEIVDFLGFIDVDAGGKEVPLISKAPDGRRAQAIFSTRTIKTLVNVQPGRTAVVGGFVSPDRAMTDMDLFGRPVVPSRKDPAPGNGSNVASQPATGKARQHLLVFVTARILKSDSTGKAVSVRHAYLGCSLEEADALYGKPRQQNKIGREGRDGANEQRIYHYSHDKIVEIWFGQQGAEAILLPGGNQVEVVDQILRDSAEGQTWVLDKRVWRRSDGKAVAAVMYPNGLVVGSAPWLVKMVESHAANNAVDAQSPAQMQPASKQ